MKYSAQKYYRAKAHAAARGTFRLELIAPQLAPLSFRRPGASNGISPVLIGPAVFPLELMMLKQT